MPSLLKSKALIATPSNIENFIREINCLPELPDSYICVNDDFAGFLIRTLRANDKKLLENTKFIGFDNINGFDDPWSPNNIPEIFGTIQVDCENIGRILAHQLLLRIEYPEMPKLMTTVENKPYIF